jgi:hypothetical protein
MSLSDIGVTILLAIAVGGMYKMGVLAGEEHANLTKEIKGYYNEDNVTIDDIIDRMYNPSKTCERLLRTK